MRSIGSPTLRPPIAYPSNPIATVAVGALVAKVLKHTALDDTELRLAGIGHGDVSRRARVASSSRRARHRAAQRTDRSIDATAASCVAG